MAEESGAAAPQSFDTRAQEVLSALDEAPSVTSDEEIGQSAGKETPTPPVSWSKEEKALFQQLPPELQAAVSRREAERERLLSTRNQELARQQKALAGERARVGLQLDALIAEAERDPIVQEGARLDWERLRQENPAAFARKWPAYQQRAVILEAARAHRDQALEVAMAERHAQEEAALAARIPEWKDPQSRRALTQELRSFLHDEGYSPEEIATIRDHRTFLIALDAMRWRRAQETKRGLARKKTAAPPRMQRPGAADDQPASAEKLARLRKRALETGKLDDRAAYILAALDDEA